MNVRDNLAAGKYENKVPYVRIPPNGVDMAHGNPDTMTVNQMSALRASERQRHRDQRDAHRQNERVMTAVLKADLETEHDVVGHPRADKLWDLAWDHGHSSGYSEVINYYEDLVELLK